MKNPNLIIEQHSDAWDIRLPMPDGYLPLPSYISVPDLSLVLMPIWVVGYVVLSKVLRWTVPPRLQITISEESFDIQVCDRTTGERKSFQFPTDSLIEFRENRFEPGIWIQAQGTMKTIPTDIESKTIGEISEAVAKSVEYFRNKGESVASDSSSSVESNISLEERETI